MPAVNQTFTAWQSRNAYFSVPLTQADGVTPYTATTPTSASWVVATNSRSSPLIQKTTDPGNGVLLGVDALSGQWTALIALGPDDTTDLTPQAYYHELSVTDDTGAVVNVTIGSFLLHPSVQQYTGSAHVTSAVSYKDAKLDFGAKGNGSADDTNALQNWINGAFNNTQKTGENQAYGQQMAFLPGGNYLISKPLSIINGFGFKMMGSGGFSSVIRNTNSSGPHTGIFTTQGCAHCEFSDFGMQAAGGDTTSILFDLDWTGAGTSLQHNSFRNITTGGGGIGFRIGNSGLMGSENTFYDVKATGHAIAGLKTCNFNALNNRVIGGNWQQNGIGIWIQQGSVPFISTTFEFNANWDIQIDNSANDQVAIIGCRSESANFVNAINQAGVISGCSLLNAASGKFLRARTGGWTIQGCVSQNGQLDTPNGGAVVISSAWGRDDWQAPGSFAFEFNNQTGRTYQGTGTGTVQINYLAKSGTSLAGQLYTAPFVNDYPVVLPYAATIATDVALAPLFRVTLTGDATFSDPVCNGLPLTNPDIIGQPVRWYITQDNVGNHHGTFASTFDFGIGDGTLSTAAGVTDLLLAEWNGKNWMCELRKGY